MKYCVIVNTNYHVIEHELSMNFLWWRINS